MSREVPFDKDAKCDECGAVGAYDFMGDYACQACTDKNFADANTGDQELEYDWGW
jgi:hypothetical protein